MKIKAISVDLISAAVPKEKQHRSDYGLSRSTFEVVPSWNPILFELTDLTLKPEADGRLAIPNKPGPGIELDPDYLRKYPYDQAARMV